MLPEDVSLQRERMVAVPATGSGTLAHFPMQARLVVELALRDGSDARGAWVPAGTPVHLGPEGTPAIVGYDGRVYLQDPPAGAQLAVPRPAGSACVVNLPASLPARGRIDLGALSCQ